MKPLPPTGNPTIDEGRAKAREAARRWREKNPAKVLAANRRQRDRIKTDPARLAAARARARNYARKKMPDQEWQLRRREYARRCYQRRKTDPAKLTEIRATRLRSYYRTKADPGRNVKRLARIRAWHQAQRRNSPEYAARANLRSRLKAVLKRAGITRCNRTLSYIGCTSAELIRHIESQFTRGMKWANYGRVWHIDHIIPCAKFDLTEERQQRLCFHYLNLQPLRVEENLRKQDRLIAPAQMPLLLPAS